jgi:type I restriction enzyme R subunit
MSKPTEHKTVQARILAYAEAIGWTIVSREKAEERRAGFLTRRVEGQGGQECPPSVARAPLSLFFDDMLDAKVREFNPRYAEADSALLGQWWRLPSSLAGNRGFPFISNTLN